MTLLMCLLVGVLFAVSVYLLLGGELKEICMGVFLLGHGVNLGIITASRSPVGKMPPVLGQGHETGVLVDPLPQALVLTAIVIGFAVQAFLLTLLVSTWRKTGTLDVKELGRIGRDVRAGRKPGEAEESAKALAGGGG